MQINQQIFKANNFYPMLLITLFLPFPQYLTTYAIFLTGVNWLINADFKNKVINLFSNKYALLFISLYLIYALSLIYTINLGSGRFDLEVKMSLLLLPLFFASSEKLTIKQFNTLLIIFVIACFGASISSIIYGIIIFVNTRSISSFNYENISLFNMHHSYFSMYIALAIVITIYFLVEYFNKINVFSKILLLVLILFFIIFTIILNSKAGILVICHVLGFGMIHYYRKTKSLKAPAFILLSFIIIFAISLKLMPEIKIKMMNAFKAVENEKKIDNDTYDGSEIRILCWKTSLTIIKENPLLGVGCGDVKNALHDKYKQNKFNRGVERNYNSHNQYLNTYIATGFVGFLLLVLSLITPTIYSKINRNYLYFNFLIIISINFMFESMLETQAGVVFYAFFNSLFALGLKTNYFRT